MEADPAVVEALDVFRQDRGDTDRIRVAGGGMSGPMTVVLDGLDELAWRPPSQVDAVRRFAAGCDALIERCRAQGTPLRMLITGDEESVQAAVAPYALAGQVLYLIPWYVPSVERGRYSDGGGLLDDDQRQAWWDFVGGDLPRPSGNEGRFPEFVTVTSWPLGAVLLTGSLRRGQVTSPADVTAGRLFRDLLEYACGWVQTHLRRGGEVERHVFARAFEELAVATWHARGRLVTAADLRRRWRRDERLALLDLLVDTASMAENPLLCPCPDERASAGAPLRFHHATVAAYLVARRIAGAIRAVVAAMKGLGAGADAASACQLCMRDWMTLCGQVPITQTILSFLRDECRHRDKSEVDAWQGSLCRLIGHVVAYGARAGDARGHRPPAEEQAALRNAEEMLLAGLHACALATGRVSRVPWPDPRRAGEWLARLRGQRTGIANGAALACLGYLDLSGCALPMADLFEANLERTCLDGAFLTWANLFGANLKGAQLRQAYLEEAYLSDADLCGACLDGANLTEAHLKETRLDGVSLVGASLQGAHLREVHLEGADLTGACLSGAHFRGAHLARALLCGADLRGARLVDADCTGADFEGATIEDADLSGAVLERADLRGVLPSESVERTAAMLSRARTLHGAVLDADLEAAVRVRCANLLG